MALVFRDEKGENLTPAEVDENFRTLKAITDNLEEEISAPIVIDSVESLSAALSQKIEANEKGAANGVATLNSEGKVAETALNADRLGGVTLGDINAAIAQKLDVHAEAEYYTGGDLFAYDEAGAYFIENVSGLANSPLTEGVTGEAIMVLCKRGDTKVIEFHHNTGSYVAFKPSAGAYGTWLKTTP